FALFIVYHICLTHMYFLCSLTLRPPPSSTLFPYTTLFRSSRRELNRRFGDRTPEDILSALIDAERERDTLAGQLRERPDVSVAEDRKSTRLNSSHVKISYAVFCLKKKKKKLRKRRNNR